jgi:hypothetical protein
MQSRGFHRLRLLLAAMPLLAGVYEAYAVASPDLEHQQVIAWLATFVNKLALRLPLALILAIVVYGLVNVVGAVLLRLRRVSVAAQAARNEIELSRPRSWRMMRG